MGLPIAPLRSLPLNETIAPLRACAANCYVMNAHYPFAPPAGTCPKRFEPYANLVNNTISIHIADNKFEVLTDLQSSFE